MRPLVVAAALAFALFAACSGIEGATGGTESSLSGASLYAARCVACHGPTLAEGEFAPPLQGTAFRNKWSLETSTALSHYIATRMPPDARGSLSTSEVANLTAFIRQHNASPSTAGPPPPAPDRRNSSTADRFSATKAITDPFGAYTPVADADIRATAPGDWLTWRRTADAQGFSPLRQIETSNVGQLKLAWAWTLPSGTNEATPLVHDGVLFVRASGDIVQAIDGATGDLLWQYKRELPEGTAPNRAKSIALFGDRLFLATSDLHIVALDAKTGVVAWDVPIAGLDKSHDVHGGPLIANGKVIVGTGGQKPGGNVIVALDAVSGKEVWRFSTTDPNGNSWNGLPPERRSGGAVWTPGSYDPALSLVYFGPSATYDTAPLRDHNAGTSNDALYTNNTIALDVDTGKLVWNFSHLPNDQWDLDWAFERQIIDLKSDNQTSRVVVTAGKMAILDVLDARTGAYRYSIDTGLQDLVTAIDPKTGFKTIDRRRAPGDGTSKPICPSAIGGRNWYPSAINPATTILYEALNESCMDLTPVAPGARGLLSTGVTMVPRPRPSSDGLYGRLDAIDLSSRRTSWTVRRRAPISAGVLATAGGLVFAGFLDRQFIAFDDRSGHMLWQARLGDAPVASPVSYTAHCTQYIAVLSGAGGLAAGVLAKFTPEIASPDRPATMLWVFAIADPSSTSARCTR